MKKILTVIGARPQFIKEAPFSREVGKYFKEIIVHTGQHYDENMSKIFFEDMGIPKPDYNLDIGSGNHGAQTGRILEGIETILLKEKPDFLVVFGDTNSTLAGALAAVKLHIPVGHIEAGLRSFNRKMPEEINRIMTDCISTQLYCPTENAVNLLSKEGMEQNAFLVGDVMLDALLHFSPRADKKSTILRDLNLKSGDYHLLTIHRPENTDITSRMIQIIKGLKGSTLPIVFPRHPRLKNILDIPEIKKEIHTLTQLRIIEPVGFLDMLQLEKNASKIITDSGGVQKEAFFLRKPCINLRDETEWIETVQEGYNLIVGADEGKISDALLSFNPTHTPKINFGGGKAASAIVNHIRTYFSDEK